MKETITEINETKRWFFKEIDKISKSLAILIQKMRDFKSVKLELKKREITTDTTEILKIMRLLQAAICQFGRNEQILRKVQPSKNEPRRNIWKLNQRDTPHKQI